MVDIPLFTGFFYIPGSCLGFLNHQQYQLSYQIASIKMSATWVQIEVLHHHLGHHSLGVIRLGMLVIWKGQAPRTRFWDAKDQNGALRLWACGAATYGLHWSHIFWRIHVLQEWIVHLEESSPTSRSGISWTKSWSIFKSPTEPRKKHLSIIFYYLFKRDPYNGSL